ncbi:MAG TPA: peptidase domain-containing ABC transporter [Bacteroidales bacterium]
MLNFPLETQYDQMDCGPTCLRMIAKFYGKIYSLKTLRDKCYITHEGVSMLGISDAAESIGFRTLGVRLSYEQFVTEATLPCIVHWKQNHFVVVHKVTNAKKRIFRNTQNEEDIWLHVADPARGAAKLNASEFKKAFISTRKDGEDKGHCLLLEPSPAFFASKGEKSVTKGFTYLFSFLKSYKWLLFQLILGLLVGTLFSLIIPFLTRSIVDRGVNYRDISFLTVILFAQLALTLGQASIGFIRGWIMLHLSTRVNISLISNFLTNLMGLPLSFFESKMTGDLLQRLGDNNRIQTFLTSSFINIVFSVFNFVIFSFILASYNAIIFLTFLMGSGLYVLWLRFFLSYRRELDNRRFAQSSNNQSNLIQLITGIHEIKLNNCEKQKRWEWESIQARLFKISTRNLMVTQVQNAGALLINGAKNFIITYFTAKAVIDGQITLGVMLSVQYIIGQLNSPVEQMIGFMQNWQDAKLSLNRLLELQIQKGEDTNENTQISELPVNKGITIKDLSFQYEGPRSPFVLKDINLIIPARRVTAIVGTSGSGKTTLLKLLLGFYPPTEGQILIGETQIDSINCHVWRKHTGAVMQDGFIFNDTIANNITISDEIIDKERLHNAVTIANIKEFIESLPLMYNTKIGPEGLGISQGQKQRILLARNFYKNPDYVFLDEATNSLDSANEQTILKRFKKFSRGKTVVIVAHRISTVRHADNIIVLEKGKIIEQGTHEELVSLNGAYFNLVKNQLELGN